VDFIERHNSNPQHTFTVAMNNFGDWSYEEYSSMQHEYRRSIATNDLPQAVQEYNTESLPTNWDWRAKGAVTPIKNQLQCGSSPYFGAVVSVEGCHMITTGTLVSLSEQQIIDCSSSEGNEACNGGEMTWSFQSVIEQGGIDTEACYPYTSEGNATCKYSPKSPCCGSIISSYVNVTSGSESAMQSAVYLVPVATAVSTENQEFEFYSRGIFNHNNCSQDPDHGIAVVGYGVNGTLDYWILKNSWGTEWGMEGFMYLARNAGNMCGIASYPSYALGCSNCPQ